MTTLLMAPLAFGNIQGLGSPNRSKLRDGRIAWVRVEEQNDDGDALTLPRATVTGAR
jgi:hypothetical protein